MMAGLLRTQIQNNFKFKSLFSKMSLFIHNSTFIYQLSTPVFHTWNSRGTEGVKFTSNRSRHKSLPAYQCFKGELDIKHAT